MLKLMFLMVLAGVLGTWFRPVDMTWMVTSLELPMSLVPLFRVVLIQLSKIVMLKIVKMCAFVCPVQHAKEQFARFAAGAVAPYYLVAVARCRDASELAAFLLLDWLLFVTLIGSILFSDRFDRQLTSHASTGSRCGWFLRRSLGWLSWEWPLATAPEIPSTWPVTGWEGRALWRRLWHANELMACTGVTLVCMVVCGVMHMSTAISVAPDERHPLLRAYTPQGARSLGYIGVLVLSEVLQDLITWRVVVLESCVPNWAKQMTDEMKLLLTAKLYPPILRDSAAFGFFVAPIVASGCITSPFVYGLANMFEYERNATWTAYF